MAQILSKALYVAASALCLVACSGAETSAAQTAGADGTSTGGFLSEVSFPTDEAGVSIGNPDATVVLVEYASLTCGHCKTFHEEVMPTIKRDYIQTGKVRFVFREFPTPPAEIAVIGFAVARCAGPEGYLPALDDFFANQNTIFEQSRQGNGLSALQAYGERNGISESEFEPCINSEEVRRAISKSVISGHDSGVTSTPTLILDGEVLTSGESRTSDGLSSILDAALGQENAEAQTTQPDAGSDE